MKSEPRLLRAHSRSTDPSPPVHSPRYLDRQERILMLAQSMMADFGHHALTSSNLAAALEISPTAFRRHFTDPDALLGEILRRHLRALAAELGKIPHDTENRRQKQREAYVAYTRTPLGGFTAPHLLLVRDRHELPLDELHSIEETRHGLGAMLAGQDDPQFVLSMLDNPYFDAARIEANLTPRPAAPVPVPVPVPEQPEQPEQPATPAIAGEPETRPATVCYTNNKPQPPQPNPDPSHAIATAGNPRMLALAARLHNLQARAGP